MSPFDRKVGRGHSFLRIENVEHRTLNIQHYKITCRPSYFLVYWSKLQKIQTMNKILKTVVLITLLFAQGCASTDKMVLDNTKRPPTENVQLIESKEVADKSSQFAVIEFIGSKEDEFKAIRYLTKEAKKMGATKMLITQESFQKWVGFTPTVAVKYQGHLY